MALPTADISSFTPEQKALFTSAAQLGSGVQTTNNGQTYTLSSANLSSPGATTTLPQTPVISTPSTAPPAMDFGVQQKQATYDQSQNDLKSLYDALGQQPQATQTAENAAGLPQLQAQRAELYARDASYQADLSNIASQNLQGVLGQQNTATSEYGRQANIKDLNFNTVIAQQNTNIQRATNAAVISAVEGRIALAKDYVQKAIDIQFSGLKAKIDYQTQYLQRNQQSLDNAEQAKLQYEIAQNTRQYNEGVQTKQAISDVLLAAAKNGADNLTLSKIQQAPDQNAAIAAAGQYLQTPSKTTSPGSTPTPSNYQFTTTQLNGGAVRAGLPLTSFQALEPDVQNYFVSTPATNITQINSLLSEVSAGTKTSAEIKTMIDSSNMTPAVKAYWTNKLNAITPPKQTGTIVGNALSGIWNGIKSLF